MSLSHRLLAVLFVPLLALGLTACDSNDDMETRTIVTVAQNTPELDTFVDALVAADLNANLQDDGPYTVFAPANSAFAALGEDTMDRLLASENQALLQKVLRYHVVSGRYLAEDLEDGQTLTTVAGDTLTISLDDDESINDGPTVNSATITETDLTADNGVIHIIDGVLTENLDAVDVATARGFDTFVDALVAADLDADLREDGPYTVFAPTEDAFAGLLAELDMTAEELLALDDLADLLNYHVVPGRLLAADLTDGQELETLQGETLTVNVTGETITLVDATSNTVAVVEADVATSNGVIHAVDGVLLRMPLL